MDTPQKDETRGRESNDERNEAGSETEETEELDERIELDHFDFKELFQKDLLKEKEKTRKQVKVAKLNVAGLVNFCDKNNLKIESTQIFDRDNKSRIDTEKLIKQGFREAKEKAQTDLQVIQLYDKSLTNEIQDHIKNDFIDKSYKTITKKTKTDFQNTQENTEILVTETKSTVENFINTISENAARDEGRDNSPAYELLQKMKTKAQNDFQKSNAKSQTLSSKTKVQIKEKLFANPTGIKSQEDLESEEMAKENIIEFSEKIKDDILREKFEFTRAVDEAKGNVGLNLFFPKNADDDFRTNRTKLERLYDKTKSDFKEVNEKMREDVTTLKEQIDIPNDIVISDNEDIPEVLNKFPETAQADFKETNVKIQENVKNLKSKISQGVTLEEDPESSERQKEFSRVVENSLNEFQEMAKNDFQETNEKVKDNVVVAKSKIDQSVNKLKDNLFFKGL